MSAGCLGFAQFGGTFSMQSEKSAGAVIKDQAAPPHHYEIRRAKPEDLPGAFALVNEYFETIQVWVRDSRDEFAKYLDGTDSALWLAFDHDQAIGCIVLHPLTAIPGCGEVKRLYVRAPYRKQGLADQLLRALEQFAKERRYEWLYLDTKDDLETAIRFYERNGYDRCARYNSNPQATIFMRKRMVAKPPPVTIRCWCCRQ
jgi:GNAT superfamily N-acetyltransferase